MNIFVVHGTLLVVTYLISELSAFSHVSDDWHLMTLRDGAESNGVIIRRRANDSSHGLSLGKILQLKDE